MSKGTAVRTVRIDDETWDAAKAEADRRGVSVSVVVRDSLRKALAGLVLLAAAVVLSGCGGTAAASVAPAKAVPAKVAAVKADEKAWDWSCDLPITIVPMAGHGITHKQMTDALTPAVARIRALGYHVVVAPFATYRHNVTLDGLGSGQVTVTATLKAAEQPSLEGNAAMTTTKLDDAEADAVGAVIAVDADTTLGELSGNVITHELGHVIGLDHKAGTVMAVDWDAPDTFDAAEVAAVSCR